MSSIPLGNLGIHCEMTSMIDHVGMSAVPLDQPIWLEDQLWCFMTYTPSVDTWKQSVGHNSKQLNYYDLHT